MNVCVSIHLLASVCVCVCQVKGFSTRVIFFVFDCVCWRCVWVCAVGMHVLMCMCLSFSGCIELC